MRSNFEIEIRRPTNRFWRWLEALFRPRLYDRVEVIIYQRSRGQLTEAFTIHCYAAKDGTLTTTVNTGELTRHKKVTNR